MSLLSATSFLRDGDTALWVPKSLHRMGVTNTVGDDYYDPSWFMSLNRPCDVCEGHGWDWKRCADEDLQVDDPVDYYHCPCDSGRHTFDIEVQCVGTLQPNDHGGLSCDGGCGERPPWGVFAYRVHVIDVLEAVEQTEEGGCPDGPHICVFYGRSGGEPTEDWTLYDGDCMEQEITPPPDAARILAEGKKVYIVRLAIHS